VPETLAGSLFFYGWHVALGYLAGAPAAAFLERYSLAVLIVIAALALGGLVVWLGMRHRRGAAVSSWADAACPACLALAAVRDRQVAGLNG